MLLREATVLNADYVLRFQQGIYVMSSHLPFFVMFSFMFLFYFSLSHIRLQSSNLRIVYYNLQKGLQTKVRSEYSVLRIRERNMAEKQVDDFTFNSLKLLHIVFQSNYSFSHDFFL